MDHILNLEDTNRMLDLDKLALELMEGGDMLEAELITKKQIDGGIEVRVVTINFSKDDYQYSSSTKRLHVRAPTND